VIWITWRVSPPSQNRPKCASNYASPFSPRRVPAIWVCVWDGLLDELRRALHRAQKTNLTVTETPGKHATPLPDRLARQRGAHFKRSLAAYVHQSKHPTIDRPIWQGE